MVHVRNTIHKIYVIDLIRNNNEINNNKIINHFKSITGNTRSMKRFTK